MTKIIFQPMGLHCQVQPGENVLDVARRVGIEIASPCGGNHICGKCKVQLSKVEGGLVDAIDVNPVTHLERRFLTDVELADGFRLACETKPQENMMVYVPEGNRNTEQVIVGEGNQAQFDFQPNVRLYRVKLAPPSLEDYRDDCQRLLDALHLNYKELSAISTSDIAFAVLQKLPVILRKAHWQVTVVVLDNRIIDVMDIYETVGFYGVAVDLGTTTIAAALLDLQTGQLLQRASCMNSQICYGDDVIARVSHCMQHEQGLQELTQLVRHDINKLLADLCHEADVKADELYELVIAGNTVMEHLLLGISPEYIGKSPFVSGVRNSLNLAPALLELAMSVRGNVHILPAEAGFVGADNVAVLLAQRPDLSKYRTMIIDIGTNGEIVYGNQEHLWSTSCATGPALEGAQISFGMRAAAGAIEQVRIPAYDADPVLKVIGQQKPMGICGSGIIDVVAELLRTGLILQDGNFNKQLEGGRLRRNAKKKLEYVLVWQTDTANGEDIVITQKDIRAVQLAKGALYAGAELLIKKCRGLMPERLVLAGAFGSYIDKANASYIGMFPDVPLEMIDSVGNAASEGAKAALLDVKLRQKADVLARTVEFVEAASAPDFQQAFFQGMLFAKGKKLA